VIDTTGLHTCYHCIIVLHVYSIVIVRVSAAFMDVRLSCHINALAQQFIVKPNCLNITTGISANFNLI